MTIVPHDEADRTRLVELVRRETDAKQRDRYRAVLLAMDGLEGDAIAEMTGRSPRFVDEWAARYRRGGLAALRPRRQPGRAAQAHARTGGAAQGTAGRRGAGRAAGRRRRLHAAGQGRLRRIVEQEFGVRHTLGGIYDVLRRLGYSSLVPRPRHRKHDPAAAAKFQQEHAPLLPAP